jgi:hypothetical protein
VGFPFQRENRRLSECPGAAQLCRAQNAPEGVRLRTRLSGIRTAAVVKETSGPLKRPRTTRPFVVTSRWCRLPSAVQLTSATPLALTRSAGARPPTQMQIEASAPAGAANAPATSATVSAVSREGRSRWLLGGSVLPGFGRVALRSELGAVRGPPSKVRTPTRPPGPTGSMRQSRRRRPSTRCAARGLLYAGACAPAPRQASGVLLR